MNISIQNLSFVLAYISAFLSAQYALAKNPVIVNQFLTSIASLFRHCNQSSTAITLEIWRIPDKAILPICFILGGSISSIVRHLELDRIYSSLMFIALSGTAGLSWAFDLPTDLVVFGLLPLLLVTALLATRIVQNIGRSGNIQEEEQMPLTEKS